MLQQTQVETVKPYFLRFIKAFPTIKKLAVAKESEVLRLWEGLGYYRRARGLHAAAKQIVAEHQGEIPRDVATLMSLPGIGRYTAGAIASIAFGQRAPILEANTIRLLARLLAYTKDPLKAPGQHLLWATAEEILPKANVARFNQALMELGSLVCTATQPKCDQCPVSNNCGAFNAGLQNQLPRVSTRIKFTDIREVAVVVRKNERLIVRQCGQTERWAGLWDFPRFKIESEEPMFVEKELIEKVREQTAVLVELDGHITTIKHGVTRYRITLDCYTAKFVSGRLKPGMQWIKPAQLAELPLSTTGRTLANRIVK